MHALVCVFSGYSFQVGLKGKQKGTTHFWACILITSLDLRWQAVIRNPAARRCVCWVFKFLVACFNWFLRGRASLFAPLIGVDFMFEDATFDQLPVSATERDRQT